MRHFVMSVVIGGLLMTGSAMVAAPGGQTTLRPGEMTEARVWVQNRDPRESIPVSLQDAGRDLPPLRVRVVNGQQAAGADEPVRVVAVRQRWEYRTVLIPAGTPAGAGPLTGLGAEGWETTGVSFVAADGGVAILMKRPY